MPKFAANLTMLFTEVPFRERFELARKAGFRFVEYLFPYAFKAEELRTELQRHGLQQVLFNLPAGDWSAGERGIAALPGREDEFRAGVARAIEYARALEVSRLNCLAGKRVPGYSDEEHWRTLVGNVRYAATELEKVGLELLIEPINHFDAPGFFLNRTEVVLKLLGEVNRPNVKLQYDVYHAQREEGELAGTITKHLARIGHIQIADNPGRHQPGTGEINFRFLFDLLDKSNYQGYVGLEYVPTPDTMKSLDWVVEYGLKL